MQINKNFINLKISKEIKNVYLEDSLSRLNSKLDSIANNNEALIKSYLSLANLSSGKIDLKCFAKLQKNPNDIKNITSSLKELMSVCDALNSPVFKNLNNPLLKTSLGKKDSLINIFQQFSKIVDNYDLGIDTLEFIDNVNKTNALKTATILDNIKLLDRSKTEFVDKLNKNHNLETTFDAFYKATNKLIDQKKALNCIYVPKDIMTIYEELFNLDSKLSSVFAHKKQLNKAVEFIDGVNNSKKLFTTDIEKSLKILEKSKVEFIDKLNKDASLDTSVNKFYKSVTNLNNIKLELEDKYVPSDTLKDYQVLYAYYQKLSSALTNKTALNNVISLENKIIDYFNKYSSQINQLVKEYQKSVKQFFIDYRKKEKDLELLISDTNNILKLCSGEEFNLVHDEQKQKINVLKSDYNSLTTYLKSKKDVYIALDTEKQITEIYAPYLKELQKLHSNYDKDKAKMLTESKFLVSKKSVSDIESEVVTLEKSINNKSKPFISNMDVLNKIHNEIDFINELLRMQKYVLFYNKYINAKKDDKTVKLFRTTDNQYKKEKFKNAFPYYNEWIKLRNSFAKAEKSNSRKSKVASFFSKVKDVLFSPVSLFIKIFSGETQFISVLVTILGIAGIAALFIFTRTIFPIEILCVTAATFVLTTIFSQIGIFLNHDYQTKPLFILNLLYPLLSFIILACPFVMNDDYLFSNLFISSILVSSSVGLALVINSVMFVFEIWQKKYCKSILGSLLVRFIYILLIIPLFNLLVQNNPDISAFIILAGVGALEINYLIRLCVKKDDATFKMNLLGSIASALTLTALSLLFMIPILSIILGIISIVLHVGSYIEDFADSIMDKLNGLGAFIPFAILEAIAILIIVLMITKVIPYEYSSHLSMTILTFIVTSIICIVGLKRNSGDFTIFTLIFNSLLPMLTLTMLLNPLIGNINTANTVYMAFAFIALSSLTVFETRYLENAYKLFIILTLVFIYLIPIGYLVIRINGGIALAKIFYFIFNTVNVLFLILSIVWQNEESFENVPALLFGFGGMFVLMLSIVSFVFGGFNIFLGIVEIFAGFGLCIASITKYDL